MKEQKIKTERGVKVQNKYPSVHTSRTHDTFPSTKNYNISIVRMGYTVNVQQYLEPHGPSPLSQPLSIEDEVLPMYY